MRRTVQISPHKARAVNGLHQLSKQVAQTFPDMQSHLHIQDAAREAAAGRYDGARRHLDAAINSFAPANIRRHGVWDDVGHAHAKEFMQLAHRHLLLVKDLEDIRGQNDANAEEHRDRRAADAQDRAMKNAQPDPTGRSDRAAEGPDSPQPVGSKQFTWEDIVTAIELAAPGRQYRYKHGWIKLSMDALAKSNPAWTPDHPGFGQPSMQAAKAHVAAARKATTPGAKNKHMAFAKAHMRALGKSAGKAMRNARPAYTPDQPGFGMSNLQRRASAVELVGPKGYSHGWIYHGPTSPAHPGQVQTGHGDTAQWINPRPGSSISTEADRDVLPLSHARVKALDGQQVHAARSDGKGAVVGKLNHNRGTVTEARSGQEVPVRGVEPTWNEYGWKGPKGSRLPKDVLSAIKAFQPPSEAAQHVYDAHDRDMINFIRQHNPGFASQTPGIELSADTGRLATQPHPLGKPGGPGLWHVKGMELPPYIQNIARALLRTGRAKSESQAIAIAKGATNRWARGGGKVSPEVRAASAATNASWDAKRGRAHAHANSYEQEISLVNNWGPWDQQQARAGHQKGATASQKHLSHLAHLAHLAKLGKATPAQKAELARKMKMLPSSKKAPVAAKVKARVKAASAAKATTAKAKTTTVGQAKAASLSKVP
jgi:hypothetical protein